MTPFNKITLTLLVFLTLLILQCSPDNNFRNMTVDELHTNIKNKTKSDYLVLDVRTPQEYYTFHIEDAKLIPYQTLPKRLRELESYKDKDIYVICLTASRSSHSSKVLSQSGFKNVYNVTGGMVNWAKNKYPIIRGFKTVNVIDFYNILKQRPSLNLIDVRHPIERSAYYIEPSVNIPMKTIFNKEKKWKYAKNDDLYLISHGDRESEGVAAFLASLGYKNIFQITGGMKLWAVNGYPVSHSLGKAYNTILVQDLHEKIANNPNTFVLDVRTPKEYTKDGRIKNSILLPVQELKKRISEISDKKNTEVHVICRSGSRSTYASKILIENGFKKVTNIMGAMNQWKKMKYPTEYN